jgi:hypothetical protein
MKKYNLGFISDHDIFQHVKDTVLKYRFQINLAAFNINLVDPIKLTFDSKVYKKCIEDVLESEIIRQLDKSNTNHIGYFHQNIFKYIGDDWVVPETGFDVINPSKHIYVEMKNKHNTMNASSSKNTFIRMQSKLLEDPAATCMLVEVIAAKSQNIKWSVSIDGNNAEHEHIRRVSIDKFYEMVTGNNVAFKNLCLVLPAIIEDVVASVKLAEKANTVVGELRTIDDNVLKSIYLLSFSKYEGFHDFTC